MAKPEYVVFENSLGEEISNDPRWQAEKTLADAGVEVRSGAQRPADHDDYIPTAYDSVTGTDLGKLAKSRGIEIKGRKAGEIRADLVALDEAEEAAAAAGDADASGDDTAADADATADADAATE